MRADSLRRGESPVPSLAPPGLAPAGVNGGTHNIGGVRIDVDAARGYERSEEEVIMTPIKPSAKALGKRRAAAEEPPDEEELGVLFLSPSFFFFFPFFFVARVH